MSQQFRVGVGRSIITPPVGGQLYGYGPNTKSTSVNDDLTVTAIALEYASMKAILISATVCSVNTKLADELRQKISKCTNVPVENIILSATHTHSGPNTDGTIGWGDIDREYCEKILLPETILAAEIAMDGLKPAVMGIGITQSEIGINRRQLSEDGRILLGQNPWGVYDNILTVISFKDANGSPIANMIHYGAHGTASGCNNQITRDWSGVMTDRLEKETGAVTAFFNGAIGDVGPRLTNGQTTGDITYAMELGGVAAMDALRAFKNIKEYSKVSLDCIAGELTLPYNPRMSLEQAREVLEEFNRNPSETNVNTRKYNYFKKVIASYEANEMDKTDLNLPQTIIRIGNVVLIQFPYEFFSELSLRLRKHSPYTHTLCLSNANGSESYLPSQDQICRGGYEIEMFLTNQVQSLTYNADDCIMNESLKLLKSLDS